MTHHQNFFIEKISEKLKQNASAENAAPMKAYLKNRFEFFGIKSPERREIFRAFLAENDLPRVEDLEEIIIRLFDLPQREFHYFAIELAGKFKTDWTENSLELFEKMIAAKSWWDSVDSINSVCIKPYFQKFPERRFEITQKWIESENIWFQRLSVIFQLGLKDKTDVELLFRNILQLSRSKEFFVQKAIGWALRDLARTKTETVKTFVAENDLKPLSKREALKNL